MEILIIKTGARGDVVRTTSLLPGLKEKYPKSKITWLVEEGSEALLKNNNYIDVIRANTKENLNNILMEKFDWVINLEEDYDSASLTTRLKPKRISGNFLEGEKIVPTPSAKEWYDMGRLGKKPKNDILKKKNKKTYQQCMLDITQLKNPRSNELLYWLNNNQKEFVKEFKRRYNINEKEIIIGVNTGSGKVWPSKSWSEKKTAKLIDAIYKKFKAKIILFGGKNEEKRNEKIISLTNVPIISTGCGNDLREFPALISICHIFITTDTLGLHVALSLKRRVVALFGPTSANEIEMYGLGEKIVSTAKDACSYKPNSKSMEKINVEEVMKAIERQINYKISIIITSFNEPGINKAIESVVTQKIPYKHEVIVAAPDEKTKNVVAKYKKKYPELRFFKDPGKGKAYALNLLFNELERKTDILILTDGDVFLGDNSVQKIMEKFKDPQVGCVTGRVISSNSKKNMMGYWSHLLADAGAHKIRKELDEKGDFLECSGYLFGFRNIVRKIPINVAEDTVIPFMLRERGYKIRYADEATVFVKNPTKFKEWLKQRKRTAKSHETLGEYADIQRIKRVKSFSNELKKGVVWALRYPKTAKEYGWTYLLFLARLYMWAGVFMDTKIKKRKYTDKWERVDTAR